MPIREEVVNWFEEAKADLKHSKVSIDVGSYNWACFAAHQAAEKALKSLILHVSGEYARGHDLIKLYNLIRDEVDIELDLSRLSRLSAYYTQARYPNAGLERPSLELTKAQAEEAFNIAEEVINEVSKNLGDP